MLAACGRGETAARTPPTAGAPSSKAHHPVTSTNGASASLLEQAQAALAGANGDCSVILSDPVYMPIHSSPEFRQLAAQNAQPRPLVIVTPEEPGTAMIMRGVVLDAKRTPLADALVLVYHTDANGLYTEPTSGSPPSGDPHSSRLFGYVRTGPDGRFEVHTIKPVGYANTQLPAHVHIEIWRADGAVTQTEMLFADDPNLSTPDRARAQRDGYLATQSTDADGVAVYSADFVV